MRPHVSVVIPAYNNAQHVALAIESVLAQRFDDYELVVADHSSSDGTHEILLRYAEHPKVRVLAPTPAGGGALANWNRVSAQARGTLLKLVCGDDLIAPDALADQAAALDANPSAALVASPRDIIDGAGRIMFRNRGLSGLDGLTDGRRAIRASVRSGTNLFGEPGCVMFRRELLDRAGGWDSEFPYLIDQATYTHLLMHGDLLALRKPLASFRVSTGQWSVRLMKQQAEQTMRFHRALRQRNPGLLTASDVLVGGMRARALAVLRRVAYLGLRDDD